MNVPIELEMILLNNRIFQMMKKICY